MERQKPVNSVQHNDDFSKALMESYAQWMDGNTFQDSDPIAVNEDGIPAEQKQGGTSFTTFDTPIGTVPAPENDDSKEIPVIPELGVKDETAPNDVKKGAGAPDPAVDLRIGAGIKQSHGATIRDVTKVAKEELEVVGPAGGGQGGGQGGTPAGGTPGGTPGGAGSLTEEGKHCCKKCGSMKHTTEECKATKEEVEKYQWDIVSEALTLLGELTETKYTVRGVRLDEQHKTTSRLLEYSKRVKEKNSEKK